MKYDPRFLALWDRAWRKTGKRAAYKSWLSLSDEERDEVEAVWETHRAHLAEKELCFRPMVSTWLNQGRWEDELGDPIEVDPREREYREQVEQFGYGSYYERNVQ